MRCTNHIFSCTILQVDREADLICIDAKCIKCKKIDHFDFTSRDFIGLTSFLFDINITEQHQFATPEQVSNIDFPNSQKGGFEGSDIFTM